jgi:DNA-binding NtrC family response regulator
VARILVIDDEEPIRQLLCKILRIENHEVIQAANGREGLQICDLMPVDLVITDIIMPETEGLETIIELRRRHPSLPVFAISGAGPAIRLDVLSIAVSFGARRSFEKPFSPGEILTAVRDELATAIAK